jgi:hypothetical protein
MSPIVVSKLILLTEMVRARFPKDEDVSNAQQPTGTGAFVAAMETIVVAKEEEALAVTRAVVAHFPVMKAGSRHAKEEAWALVAAITKEQAKAMVEVVEDAAQPGRLHAAD